MSGNNTKGSAPRLVHVPGYHIHPQYDMVHTRHLIKERRNKKASFHLNLAPMVDMFSILVIYLIMNFSSDGEVFFIARDIKIPQIVKGIPMQSFPLISIVGEKVMFDAQGNDGNSIYVEETNDGISKQLRSKLNQIKRVEEEIGGAKNFKGQINIQADEKTDMDEVKRVMRVLVDEGWNTINFIVEPQSQRGRQQ